MNKNKPLVVVMSRNYSTGLSIIRSLGIEGYPVDLIASANRTGQSATIAGSKYINNYVEVIAKKVELDRDEALLKV